MDKGAAKAEAGTPAPRGVSNWERLWLRLFIYAADILTN